MYQHTYAKYFHQDFGKHHEESETAWKREVAVAGCMILEAVVRNCSVKRIPYNTCTAVSFHETAGLKLFFL